MKLTLTEFVTVDGVSQGPGSPDEDPSDGFTRGGWFVPHLDEAFVALAVSWLGEADGLLFGSRTYTNFARDWPQMTDPDDPIAPTMNSLPKYVVSRSITRADDWTPTTILAGDAADEVAKLKQEPGRELQIHGSARLARSLLEAGLIDVVRLAIAPVVVGSGRRLFPDGGAPAGLRLVRTDTTPAGVVVHTYESTGSPEFGTYSPGA